MTPGNAHKSKELLPLISGISVPIDKVIADKAYDSAAIRDTLEACGIEAVIPPTTRWRNPPDCDMETYKARHLVENAFADLKQFRGIATRYCKLAVTFCELLSLVFWYLNTKSGRRGSSPHLDGASGAGYGARP